MQSHSWGLWPFPWVSPARISPYTSAPRTKLLSPAQARSGISTAETLYDYCGSSGSALQLSGHCLNVLQCNTHSLFLLQDHTRIFLVLIGHQVIGLHGLKLSGFQKETRNTTIYIASFHVGTLKKEKDPVSRHYTVQTEFHKGQAHLIPILGTLWV